MHVFYELMALFWTLAEGLILIFIRQGFLFLTKGKTGQGGFVVFCAGAFLLLSLVIFGEETFLPLLAPVSEPRDHVLYRWGVWDFFCTVWVALEGAIMVYVIRIYRTLRRVSEKGPGERDRAFSTHVSSLTLPLLVSLLFALYFLYGYASLNLIRNHGMDAQAVYRLSLFYIRICGLFWIAFEWVVAVWGIRTYALLKRKDRKSP